MRPGALGVGGRVDALRARDAASRWPARPRPRRRWRRPPGRAGRPGRADRRRRAPPGSAAARARWPCGSGARPRRGRRPARRAGRPRSRPGTPRPVDRRPASGGRARPRRRPGSARRGWGAPSGRSPAARGGRGARPAGGPPRRPRSCSAWRGRRAGPAGSGTRTPAATAGRIASRTSASGRSAMAATKRSSTGRPATAIDAQDALRRLGQPGDLAGQGLGQRPRQRPDRPRRARRRRAPRRRTGCRRSVGGCGPRGPDPRPTRRSTATWRATSSRSRRGRSRRVVRSSRSRLASQVVDRMARRSVVAARREHEEQALLVEVAQHEREQVAGRAVDPVEVLDHEQRRGVVGEHVEEGQEDPEQARLVEPAARVGRRSSGRRLAAPDRARCRAAAGPGPRGWRRAHRGRARPVGPRRNERSASVIGA